MAEFVDQPRLRTRHGLCRTLSTLLQDVQHHPQLGHCPPLEKQWQERFETIEDVEVRCLTNRSEQLCVWVDAVPSTTGPDPGICSRLHGAHRAIAVRIFLGLLATLGGAARLEHPDD